MHHQSIEEQERQLAYLKRQIDNHKVLADIMREQGDLVAVEQVEKLIADLCKAFVLGVQ